MPPKGGIAKQSASERENNMPNFDDIIAWENGNMSEDREAVFFQKLVDSGMAWTLQGMYGRRAKQLIEEGVVSL